MTDRLLPKKHFRFSNAAFPQSTRKNTRTLWKTDRLVAVREIWEVFNYLKACCTIGISFS